MSEITSLTAILRKRLADPVADGPKKPEDIKSIAEGLIEQLLLRAAGQKDKPGEQWVIQEIWDRIDGSVAMTINETADDQP